MCVSACTCIHVCLCVCSCVWVYLYMCMCERICIYAHTRMFPCVSVCTYVCVCVKCRHDVSWFESLAQIMVASETKRMRTPKRRPPQTTGLRLPLQTRSPSLQPRGETNLLCMERDWPSMKRVGVGSFRNEQINKQMGVWKKEMVYE